MYSYLGKDYETLYTIDLLCHGITSSKVFENQIGDEVGIRLQGLGVLCPVGKISVYPRVPQKELLKLLPEHLHEYYYLARTAAEKARGRKIVLWMRSRFPRNPLWSNPPDGILPAF